MRPFAHLLLLGLLAASALAQTKDPAPPPTAPAKESPPAQLIENLRTIEPSEVRLVWHNRRWRLTHRGEVLKEFGASDQEARQALRLIQELRLNQHATLGSPQPVLEYWLSDGKPPRTGGHRGLRTVSLDPASLRVEQVQGQWCVRDASRVLFNFNQGAEEAKQALAVLRKYHFDQVGVVGPMTAPMYILMSATYGQSDTLAGSPRHMVPSLFTRPEKKIAGGQRIGVGKSQTPEKKAEVIVSPAVPPLAGAPRPSSTSKPRESAWQSPAAPAVNDRISFDWRQVKLRQHEGEWKLMSGGTVLGNFGIHVHEGQRALAALRYYRFTEQLRLGGPEPYLTYYVATRSTPLGLMLGLQGERLQPDKLELRRTEAGFAICEGERTIFRLRDREDEARKLLDTMKTEKLDRVSRIGEPGKEPMTLLLRTEHPTREKAP